MQQKPGLWNVSPALVATNAQRLWSGLAFVAPLWGGAGRGALLGPRGEPLAGANLVAGANLRWRGTPYGMGVGTSAAGALLNQLDFAPLVTSNGAYTGDFTIVTLANPKSEGRQSTPFSQTSGGSSTRVFILFNAGNVAGEMGVFTDTGGSAVFVNVAGLINGKYHLFGGRRRGATLEAFLDGRRQGFTTGTVQAIGSATAGIALGHRAEDTAQDRIATDTNIVFVAGWNRALSDAEMRMLACDPFVMLRPLPEWRGVWTAFGGGDAVLDPSDLTGGLVFDMAALSQAHNLSVADTMFAQTLEPAGISQAHLFSAGELNSTFQFDPALLAMSSQGAPGFRTRIAGNSARRKSAASGSSSKSITE